MLLKAATDRVKCPQCDHHATWKESLKTHILSMHDGMKFKCHQCDHQATQKGSLKRHILSKHDGMKFKCSQCDYKAIWKPQLGGTILVCMMESFRLEHDIHIVNQYHNTDISNESHKCRSGREFD